MFYQWHKPLFHQRVEADDAIADARGEIRRREKLQRVGQIDTAYLAIRRDDILLLHDRRIQHQPHGGHGNADLEEPPASTYRGKCLRDRLGNTGRIDGDIDSSPTGQLANGGNWIIRTGVDLGERAQPLGGSEPALLNIDGDDSLSTRSLSL